MARKSERVLAFRQASIDKAPAIDKKQTEYRIEGSAALSWS